MTDPSLDRATAVVGELASSVRRLTEEVVASEALRTRKIRVIQQAMYVMVPAVVLLVVLAFTNFVLLSRVKDAADSAKNTNDLLVSCFQPGTECSNSSSQKTGEAINQLRQTQFVIAICQRQNPVTEDPNGTKIVSCVQRYYPNFRLPPQVK
jgi:hypothetical protein